MIGHKGFDGGLHFFDAQKASHPRHFKPAGKSSSTGENINKVQGLHEEQVSDIWSFFSIQNFFFSKNQFSCSL